MTHNNFKYLLISVSAVRGFVSISDSASLLGIPIGILSSAIGLKIYAITAAIEKFKSIVKKKKKKHDKVVLLAKNKICNMEVVISKI